MSSRMRHTILQGDWSSDVCSSDLRWQRRSGAVAPDRRADRDDVSGDAAVALVGDRLAAVSGLADPRGRTVAPFACRGRLGRSEERRVGQESRTRRWSCWETEKDKK